LTARAIVLCLLQLKGKLELHRKSKEAETEVKEAQTRQLEYLSSGARSLGGSSQEEVHCGGDRAPQALWTQVLNRSVNRLISLAKMVGF
jgi:hypothetical protein